MAVKVLRDSWRTKKYVGKSKMYKHVYIHEIDGQHYYRALINLGLGNWGKFFESERQAALAVDKKLLESGKEPVNILVKK